MFWPTLRLAPLVVAVGATVAVAGPNTARDVASAPEGASTEVAWTTAGATTGHAFGVVSDVWSLGRWSSLGQIEALLASDPERALHGFRLAYGAGPGLVRPQLRAGVHAGIGLEVAPMRAVSEEDHAGGTAFLDARATASIGRAFVSGSGRLTYYYDLDCRDGEGVASGEDTSDGLPSCGRHTSDFAPHLGWEAEARIGPRTQGEVDAARHRSWFVGTRYFAVATSMRIEQHVLVSLGWAVW